jgi:hypothetical protein
MAKSKPSTTSKSLKIIAFVGIFVLLIGAIVLLWNLKSDGAIAGQATASEYAAALKEFNKAYSDFENAMKSKSGDVNKIDAAIAGMSQAADALSEVGHTAGAQAADSMAEEMKKASEDGTLDKKEKAKLQELYSQVYS